MLDLRVMQVGKIMVDGLEGMGGHDAISATVAARAACPAVHRINSSGRILSAGVVTSFAHQQPPPHLRASSLRIVGSMNICWHGTGVGRPDVSHSGFACRYSKSAAPTTKRGLRLRRERLNVPGGVRRCTTGRDSIWQFRHSVRRDKPAQRRWQLLHQALTAYVATPRLTVHHGTVRGV